MKEYTLEIGSIRARITPRLGDTHSDGLNKLLSYKTEDAWFSSNPLYDGTVHLFDVDTQTFFCGLIERVKKYLDDAEITYQVKDYREFEDFDPTTFPLNSESGIDFRYYQKDAIRLAKEHKCGVIGLPTGAGKTFTMGGLISEIGVSPTVFYVPRVELMHQTIEAYTKLFGMEIGYIGESQINLQPLTVATVQTVSRAIRAQNNDELLEWLLSVKMILMDECHHTPADTLQEICYYHTNAYYRFGASATPFRDDGEDMKIEAALGTKFIDVKAKELIDAGYLVSPTIYVYDVYPEPEAGKCSVYNAYYKNHLVHNLERNKQIVQCAKKLQDWDKTVLVPVGQIAHGELLHEMMLERDVHAEFIKGEMAPADRRVLLDRLSDKELSVVICTSQIGSEGLDIPSLDALINAGGGKSVVQTLQRVGRCIRPYTSPTGVKKTEAIVIDFKDQVKYLKDHSNKRLRTYRTEYGAENIKYIK